MMKSTCGVLFALAFVLCILQSNAEPLGAARKPTTIKDIPAELLLIIYESCDLASLNALAELHPFYRQVAGVTFFGKFGKITLTISYSGLHIKPEVEYHTPVKIGNENTMFLTLKTFGHLITKLHVNYDYFNEAQCERINEHINKYLTDSLIELSSKSLGTPRSLTGPFNKVEIVKFVKIITPIDTNLGTVFPAMRSLSIWSIQDVPAAVINHHFPHLEELNEFMTMPRGKQITEVLEFNPHLRNLSMGDVRWNLLQKISENPNLEHLEIGDLIGADTAFERKDIYFENVKSFSMNAQRYFQSDDDLPIIFPKLELIRLYEVRDISFNIVKRHRNLKKVILSYPQSEHIQWMATEEGFNGLPHLEEFYTQKPVTVDFANIIVRLMAVAKNLKKITLWNCQTEFQDSIFEQVQTEWDIIKCDEKIVSFVRYR